MTKIARIQPNQAVALQDFKNMIEFPRDAIDAIIKTAISGQIAGIYAGASVVKSGTTTIDVQGPFFLYRDDKLFTNADGNVSVNFLNDLPTEGNRRIAAILLQGETVDTDTQPRDFEVDGSTYPPLMDPQPTATVTHRRAKVAVQLSDSAPSPVRPVVDTANTVVAWVTLSSTEVVTVEQNLAARANSVRVVDGRLKIVEDWKAQAEPTIQGLKADVAKLLAGSKQNVDRKFQGYLLEQLARLNERVGVDQGASYSVTNYFLDTDDSETQHVSFLCKVEEGIRFSDDNFDTSALALLTPGDTTIQLSAGGLVLPKYADTILFSVKGRDAEIALSNGGSQTVEYNLKTISKTRIRYGASFLVCTNAQWWQTGRYDSVEGVFYKDGIGYSVDFAEQHPSGDPNHSIKRLRQLFVDTYEEPYWEATTVAASYTGQVGSNTFLMPRSAWITGFNLGFSRVDGGGGDVRLALCETHENGAPNFQKALAHVTLPHASLKAWPLMTTFKIEPTYVEGGKRVGWFVITPGNHWLAMVEGNKYAQGSYFSSTDGVSSQGSLSQDACFEVLVADFEASRLVVNLNNFNLSGGITDIDLLVKKVAKAGAFDIYFEVQVGSNWVTLAEVASGNSPLYGLPAALNARMVMVGTTDLMPGIKLNESYVTLSRPRTNGVHISKARTAPSNVDEVHIVALLEHYVEANHNCVAKLRVGAGYNTEINATSTTDELLPDGSVRRTYVFSGLTPTATWKSRVNIDTVSALSVFLVSETTEVGFPA